MPHLSPRFFRLHQALPLVFLLLLEACGHHRADADLDPNRGSDDQVVLLGGGPLYQAGAVASDANATPLFLGRVASSDPNGPEFGWPGSGMVVRFAGPKVQVRLSAARPGRGSNSTYVAQVDDRPQVRLTIQDNVDLYDIADQLDGGDHVLVLAKDNEYQNGADYFGGLEPAGSLQLLPPLQARPRRMQVVGSSSPMGFGVLGVGHQDTLCQDPNMKWQMHSQTSAYPWLVAEAVGADLQALTFSGKGIVRNLDPVNDPVATLPYLSQFTLPSSSSANYSPQAWVPDLVVVDGGRNDLANLDAKADTSPLVQGYARYLASLRSAYPAALLVLAVSQGLADADQARLVGILDAAVAQAQVANTVKLVFQSDNGSLGGFGCDFHPSPERQAHMAGELRALLKQRLGW